VQERFLVTDNGGVIELLPTPVLRPVLVRRGAGKPRAAPRHDRGQRVGALLLRVQSSLTAAGRAWLEWLQRKEPCHSRARRWAATLLLAPERLKALVDLCDERLDGQTAAKDTLMEYWRCAALYPSLLRRRSTAQMRYAMATPPSQLNVEAVGGLRVPVMPENDTMPAHLSACGAQALPLTEGTRRRSRSGRPTAKLAPQRAAPLLKPALARARELPLPSPLPPLYARFLPPLTPARPLKGSQRRQRSAAACVRGAAKRPPHLRARGRRGPAPTADRAGRLR
jgi:hypothetical protein